MGIKFFKGFEQLALNTAEKTTSQSPILEIRDGFYAAKEKSIEGFTLLDTITVDDVEIHIFEKSS